MYIDIFMNVLIFVSRIGMFISLITHSRLLFNFSGTQVQALKLLSGLTETESGIPSVIDNTYAVPYIVCCIKESKCRSVKIGVASLCLAGLSLMLICLYKLTSVHDLCLDYMILTFCSNHIIMIKYMKNTIWQDCCKNCLKNKKNENFIIQFLTVYR